MRVIERVAGYYDVEEVEFGRVYRWCPGCVEIECECGERLVLTASATTCGECGTDHATTVREELSVWRLGDEAARPWRSWRTSGDTGIPF